MSLKDILTICLALILVVGIFALPYDFDLSIGNNVSDDKNDGGTSDTDTDTDTEDGGGNSSPIVTSPHPTLVCPTCSGECISSCENYGSIGEYHYSLYCSQCDYNDFNGFTVTHEYSNKDGICTASNCYHKCTHNFTWEAISYYLPYDERFSMFDPSTLTDGDSAVYNGICTICQKTITD